MECASDKCMSFIDQSVSHMSRETPNVASRMSRMCNDHYSLISSSKTLGVHQPSIIKHHASGSMLKQAPCPYRESRVWACSDHGEMDPMMMQMTDGIMVA